MQSALVLHRDITTIMVIIQRLVYLIPVLTTFCCQGSYAFEPQTNHIGNANFRELQCPKAEDIAPCICTSTDPYGTEVMDMDCTNVADEQQLYDVFHSDLPSTAFHRLYLRATPLTYLSDDVFGDATFYAVYAEGGSLTSLGPNTFKKSTSTLEGLILSNNQLIDFPFETIKEYSVFAALYLDRNPLQSFPASIQSETMVELHLSNTLVQWIPAASMDLPELKVLYLEDTPIGQTPYTIGKEAFVGLTDIRAIYMSNTGLRHLESLQFAVTSPHLGAIILSDNSIETVEPDTFTGHQTPTNIILSNNKLTKLPEATWKPVLDAGVTVIVDGNDLTCGCDIAWLVLEPAYHPQVASAMCKNGDMLTGLDSFFFENYC